MKHLLQHSGLGALADVDEVVAQVSLDQLEASVRFDGGYVGQRMMIERASPELCRALFARAPMHHALSERIIELARAHGLPLIAGWHGPTRKLYLNASDAAVNVREAVARDLDLELAFAPHVIGYNAGDEHVETKVYEQLPATALLRLMNDNEDAGCVGGLRAVDEAFRVFGDLPKAGLVRSHTVDERGRLEPKALFVAPKDGATTALERLGSDQRHGLAPALPFEAGRLKSIGWSERRPREWTAYFKPAGVGDESPLSTLDPALVARSDKSEIGIYVTRAATTARAYATMGQVAVSYRVRQGDARGVDALMRFLVERIEQTPGATNSVEDAMRALGGELPSPWRALTSA